MKAMRAAAAATVTALAFVMVPAHAAQLTAIYSVKGALSVSPATCDFPCVPGVTYAGSGSLKRLAGLIPPNPIKGTWSFSGVSFPGDPVRPGDPVLVGFGSGRMTISWSGAGTSRVTFPSVVYSKKRFVGVGRVTSGAFRGSLVIWTIFAPSDPYKTLSSATFIPSDPT